MQTGTGQIYIFIDKQGDGISGTGTGEIKPKKTPEQLAEEKAKKEKEQERKAITAALIQAGKQAAVQGVNVYGQLTGDITTTKSIQGVITIGADILTIAKGGWVGAIAVGTKYALQTANSFAMTTNTNRQLDYNKSLLGEISTKGSRYW